MNNLYKRSTFFQKVCLSNYAVGLHFFPLSAVCDYKQHKYNYGLVDVPKERHYQFILC